MASSEIDFTFLWKIRNLALCIQKNGEYFSSPKFTVPQFQNTTWCLKLYPKGFDKDSERYVSCFISRENCTDPKEIGIKYKLSVQKPFACNRGESFFTLKSGGFGLRKFLPLELIEIYKDFLLIECQMQLSYLEKGDLSKLEKLCLPSLLNSKSQFSMDIDEVFRPINAMLDTVKEEVIAYPRRCFACSEFIGVKRLVVWHIDPEVITGSKSLQKIPVINASILPSCIISLYLNKDEEEYLGIDICFMPKSISSPFMFVWKAHILDAETQAINSSEEEYVLNMNLKQEILHFKKVFKMKDVRQRIADLSSNYLRLNFELLFSFGEINSSFKWEEGSNHHRNLSTHRNLLDCLSDQVTNLYNEKKFCDVVLKVGSQTFDVHKTVLCALSPVFSAMFSSNRTESKTSIINIGDINEDIIRQMISFFYTGKLEQLEFENAISLYMAADKYQILLLKNMCKYFLIHSITLNNVCFIISFADMHNDILLRNIAVQFISIYKNAVLLSSQWKSFKCENLKLANEILTDVLLKL